MSWTRWWQSRGNFRRASSGIATASCRSTSAGSTGLIGPPRAIGDELRRDAAARGLHVHVAVAATRSAALVLALARPGLTVVEPGRERESLAPLPIAILEKVHDYGTQSSQSTQRI